VVNRFHSVKTGSPEQPLLHFCCNSILDSVLQNWNTILYTQLQWVSLVNDVSSDAYESTFLVSSLTHMSRKLELNNTPEMHDLDFIDNLKQPYQVLVSNVWCGLLRLIGPRNLPEAPSSIFCFLLERWPCSPNPENEYKSSKSLSPSQCFPESFWTRLAPVSSAAEAKMVNLQLV